MEITRTGPAPIAEDGVKRIGALYRIEADIRGLDPDARLAERQERSAPIIGDFEAWLTQNRARVARKSPLGEALAYIAKYWAVIASLIETYKMNAVDPHAWLATTLTAIAGGHMQSDVADLMPWNYAAKV